VVDDVPTVAVEEEFFLVSGDTLAVVAGAQPVLESAEPEVGRGGGGGGRGHAR
jgi:hypothetical protein